MVISTSVVARRYEDVSAGTPISVDIPVYEAGDVYVYYGNASLLAVQGVDYTVGLAGDFETFTVTPTASLLVKINALIADDATEENFITVRRTLGYLTDATPDGVRYTPYTSREFDRNSMRDLQLDETLKRSVRLGDRFVPPFPELTISSYEEGKRLSWGPNGEILSVDADVTLASLDVWYAVRDTESAALARAQGDGHVFFMDGYPYEVDTSLALSSSATEDLNVSGIRPRGTPTPAHFGVNLTDTVTDQSTGLQRFFDYLAANTSVFGEIWGTARGQNIKIMSGVKCVSHGFRLLVPDTAQVAHPMAGYSGTFGFYNGEALAGVQMLGLWEIEGEPGTVAANGVGGVVFHLLSRCRFGDWFFQSVPAGMTLTNGLYVECGNISGNGFRGWQVATRTGTGGSALVLAAVSYSNFGDVSGSEVWKPLVYLSVASGAGLNPNAHTKIGKISARCDSGSLEAMALAARSFEGVQIEGVTCEKGVYGFKIGGETGDTALGIVANGIRIGYAICADQQSDGAPSLIAAGYVYNPSGEQKVRGVSIGTFQCDGSRSYGWWMQNAEAHVDHMILDGQHSTSIREQLTLTGYSALSVGTLELRAQRISGMCKQGDDTSLTVGLARFHEQAVASLLGLSRASGATSTAKLHVGKIECVDAPTESGASYSVAYPVYLDAVPLSKVYVGEFDAGAHTVSAAANIDGATVTGFRAGIPVVGASAPSGGTYEVGDTVITSDGQQIRYDGTAWVGETVLRNGGEVTIASGAVTIDPLHGFYTVDTEGDAATDDLTAINGGRDGQVIVLRAANGARDVVVKNGPFRLAGADFTMSDILDTITLMRVDAFSSWVELSRSNNA